LRRRNSAVTAKEKVDRLQRFSFALRGRRCVCMDYQWCNQGHRQDDLYENLHVHFPCLYQYQAPVNLRQRVIRRVDPAPVLRDYIDRADL
jgi:hypothetical protein